MLKLSNQLGTKYLFWQKLSETAGKNAFNKNIECFSQSACLKCFSASFIKWQEKMLKLSKLGTMKSTDVCQDRYN